MFPKTFMPDLLNTCDQKYNCLIFSGTRSSCKTSLLFQAAVCAASEGRQTTFITQEPIRRLPLHVHGMPAPAPATIRSLKVIYMPDVSELISFLSDLHHQVAVLPEVLLIDNLHLYCNQLQDGNGLERPIAKLCALLSDSLHYLHEKSGCDVELYLATGDILPAHLRVYHFYFKQLLLITKNEEEKTGDKFVVSLYHRPQDKSVNKQCSFWKLNDQIRLTGNATNHKK